MHIQRRFLFKEFIVGLVLRNALSWPWETFSGWQPHLIRKGVAQCYFFRPSVPSHHLSMWCLCYYCTTSQTADAPRLTIRWHHRSFPPGTGEPVPTLRAGFFTGATSPASLARHLALGTWWGGCFPMILGLFSKGSSSKLGVTLPSLTTEQSVRTPLMSRVQAAGKACSWRNGKVGILKKSC